MPNIVNKADPSVYQLSVSESTYNAADWVVNPPSLATLIATVEPKYWKLNVGETDVQEMTQPEKDAVDAAADVALLASAKTSAKDEYDNTRGTLISRAIVTLLIDEINILRAQHALAPRTAAQARTAIRNAIDGEV